MLAAFPAFPAAGYLDPIHLDRPMGGFFEEIDTTQQRALARAASSDQANHLALGYLQVDVLQHVQAPKILIEL
jgi:hypothetical protein